MKTKFNLLLALALAVSLLLVSPASVLADYGTVDQQQTESNFHKFYINGTGSQGAKQVSQTFTPGVTGQLMQVQVYMTAGSSPVTMTIHNTPLSRDITNKIFTNPALATVTIPAPSSTGWQSFNFGIPATLTVGQQYAFVLSSTGIATFSGSFYNPYPGGNIWWSDNTPNLSIDMTFQTFMAVFTPEQAPSETWNLAIGESGNDSFNSVESTSDGGYILSGYRAPGGSASMWLVKTDAHGVEEWAQTYDKFGFGSQAKYAVETHAGDGYLVLGWTSIHGGNNNSDIWLVKTDLDGNVVDQRTWGGYSQADWALSLQRTSDGGYIMLVQRNSYVQLHKLDAALNTEWGPSTVGPWRYNTASGSSMRQTSDGGYIVAGYEAPKSYSGHSGYYGWLVKTSGAGVIEWTRSFYGAPETGGKQNILSSVEETPGGYVITGHLRPAAGVYEPWLVKTDLSGNTLWSSTFVGLQQNAAFNTVRQSPDGGYALSGAKLLADGTWDGWIVKADPVGNVEWDLTAGDLLNDGFTSAQLTPDGGYILAGYTTSSGASGQDGWLVKVGGDAAPPADTIPPVVTAPANVAAEATGVLTSVAIGAATATDNVGVVSLTDDAPASFPVGTTVVTWTAVDAKGNTGTATQTVTISDTTAPSITITTPAEGAEYLIGQSVTPVWTASDIFGVADTFAGLIDTATSGDKTFTVTAIDTYGNQAQVTHNYRVLSITEVSEQVIEQIESLNLPKGTEGSLVNKLAAAAKSLDKNNETAAVNQLSALINAVDAQSGKKIPTAVADELIAAIQAIIAMIG